MMLILPMVSQSVFVYFCLQQHRPFTVNVYVPFNLYNVVIDEIKIQLRDNTCSPEEGQKYRALLNDLRETGIDVPTQLPQYLKKQILDKVNSFNKPRSAQSRSRVLRYPAYTKISTSSQQLSWRRPNLVKSPEQIKTNTVQKIDELTADWQEKLATEQRQFTTYKIRERVDTKNDTDDEDSDVTLHTQIYKETREAAEKLKEQETSRSEHERRSEDSDVALHAQIYKETRKAADKLKEQETSQTEHERRSEKSENWRDRKERDRFKKMDKNQEPDVSKERSSWRHLGSVKSSQQVHKNREPDASKQTSSSESDDELNLGLQKMNLNVKHGQPRKGERASSVDVTGSRKSTHRPDAASASRDDERYSDRRYKSATSKAERESKHKGANERDLDKYHERSRDRCAPDGRSLSPERKHWKSKYSARNEKVREHEDDYRHSKSKYSAKSEKAREYEDDYRHSKSKDSARNEKGRKHEDDYRHSKSRSRDYDSKYYDHYDRDKSRQKTRNEDRGHQKNKSKRHSSSSEDDTKLMAKLKEVTAVFKPRTIEF